MKYKTATIIHCVILFIYSFHVLEEIMTRFFLAVIFGVWFPIVTGIGFIVFAMMIPWLWKGARWALYGSLFFAFFMTGHAFVHVYILVYLKDTLGTITGIGPLLITVPYIVFLSLTIYRKGVKSSGL